MKKLLLIAIKYNKNNWDNIKPVVDLMRGQGFEVEKRKDAGFHSDREYFLRTSNTRGCFNYDIMGSDKHKFEMLTMPQDWHKIPEALGIKVTPEYVECVNGQSDESVWHFGREGEIFKVVKFNSETEGAAEDYELDNGLFMTTDICKPSTIEAYEAQEAKKKDNVSFTADDVLKVSDAFRSESSKLRGRLLKKSNRIKELEEENERLNNVTNSANRQAALVMEENRLLIEENEKLKSMLKEFACLGKNIQDRLSELN